MRSERTTASPYAAPNTPIASAKRQRTSTGRVSIQPVKPVRIHPEQRTEEVSDNSTERLHKHESGNADLFSPFLKTEASESKPLTRSHSFKHAEHKASTIHLRGKRRSPQSQSEEYKENVDELSQEQIEEVEHKLMDPNELAPSPPAEPDERTEEEEVEAEAEEEEEEEEFNPYLLIKELPPHEQVVIPNKLCLPPKKATRKSPLTLVLDLDETLVHCSIEPIDNADLEFSVNFNGADYQVRVRKRPYLDLFLKEVAKKFEVVVFTASQRVYADKLLNLIDPHKKLIRHRLFREACLCVGGNYIKDLTVLGRDLSKVALVDNSPHAYGYQIDNGIPIESWFDDDKDTELLKLLEFLQRLDGEPDVRPVIRDHFRTFELVADA